MALADYSKDQHDEMCVSMAALILSDGEKEITADAISAIVKASGNAVEGYWPSIFASLLQGKKVEELLLSGGGGGGGGGGGEAAAEEEKKEEEEEEEVDMGGGMSMFGDEEAGGGDY